MTAPHGDWSALRSKWQATPSAPLITDGLLAGMRWRRLWSRAYLALEVASVMLMLFLVAQQWWKGQRGVAAALGTLTAVCVAASGWARLAPFEVAPSSLIGMIGLAIAGARRHERFAVATYVMIAASGLYIGFMHAAGVGATTAAYRDPDGAAVALVLLALCALGTAVYHRAAAVRRRRFEAVLEALTGQEE